MFLETSVNFSRRTNRELWANSPTKNWQAETGFIGGTADPLAAGLHEKSAVRQSRLNPISLTIRLRELRFPLRDCNGRWQPRWLTCCAPEIRIRPAPRLAVFIFFTIWMRRRIVPHIGSGAQARRSTWNRRITLHLSTTAAIFGPIRNLCDRRQ